MTEKGVAEADEAGKLLKEGGYKFDIAFTSVLKRAIKTLWRALEIMDLHWIPVRRDYRLNERHYGGLQGLNKAETAEKHGDEQVNYTDVQCFCGSLLNVGDSVCPGANLAPILCDSAPSAVKG